MISNKYQQIVRDIKKWINTGKYAADVKLPSENELSLKYGVSRQITTVAHPQELFGKKAAETLHKLYKIIGKIQLVCLGIQVVFFFYNKQAKVREVNNENTA